MKKRYITGFDGLRTIGLLAVIFYHIYPSIFRGGYLGVALFFVLSGYLITDLLLREYEANGRIAVKAFLLRRFKRLYPNMIAVMLLSTVYMYFFQKNLLNGMRNVFLSSIFSVNNWWQIAKGGSYFAKLLAEAPFEHFYSLSIEGQFYLFWPLIIIVLMRIFRKNRTAIFNVLDIILLLSFVEMSLLYKAHVDPTRIYYGTDTRLFSILMGAALAFIYPSDQVDKIKLSLRDRQLFNGMAIVTLVVLIICFFALPDQEWFTYRGGMWLFSFLSCVLIALIVHPKLAANKWLSNPVTAYLGTRSYGMYLWQIPVLTFAELKLPNPESLPSVLIALALVVILTEITYRLVEVPLRRITWRKVKDFYQERCHVWSSFVKWPVTLLVSVVVAGALFLVFTAPDKTAAQNKITDQLKQNQAKMKKQNQVQQAPGTPADPAILNKYGISQEEYDIVNQKKVAILGDSMIAMTYDDLHEVFPNAFFDGAIGRKPQHTLEMVQEAVTNHPELDTLVIGIGINRDENGGTLTADQIDQVTQAAGGRQVYWININLEKSQYYWTNDVNQVLSQADQKYDNLHIIDWYGASHDKESQLLSEDMTHPNDQGAIAYTKTIADAISK
ncbi:acyltransferase family protein [Streptococcus sobrinus]|uniref:acyltransferase family protein n=3 Tax=Streptococcus sobrinus TaxID=1310 RepID=UPI0002F1DE29|nr:acyltransferase family protein [Streptococcus sobrinus]AWN18907.1 acyltransferase [Streptococcus sobrinus]